MSKAIKDLQPGDVVRALRYLDPKGANVKRGQIGVVFHGTNYYKDGCGPIVRWIRAWHDPNEGGASTDSDGVCNVYEGDVEVVP